MVENISNIIKNGFETYTKNLNLAIPFALDTVITFMLAVFMFGFGFFYIFGSSIESLKNAARFEDLMLIILPLIARHILEIVLLVMITFIIVLIFGAFFTSGAIGMAKVATETGKCELSTMVEAGKKNFVNLFLAEILFGLLSIAGIVFIVPGAMNVNLSQLLSFEKTGAFFLLIAGLLLWMFYLLILSLVLAVFRYALVVENLGPVDSITTGLKFFSNHKSEVFILWLIVGVIVIFVAIIAQLIGFIPFLNVIWPFINILISILIIPPLTTLWWVRLYMTRTGKKIYFNELLAHPDELEANQ